MSAKSKPIVCPCCGLNGSKALLGVFPFKVCSDSTCACVWGFWSYLAFKMADFFQPNDLGPNGESGWMFLLYEGSYFKALMHSLHIEKEDR